MVQTADTIFRDFVTDGVPSSGKNNPAKPKIREWGAWLESLVQAFISSGGLIYASKSALDGDLAHAANSMAWVMGDATVANNGVYRKNGASESGSWVRAGDLPYSYIKASNVGAGTANAIVATSSIPVPAGDGAALIALPIVVDNNATPVTVTFNGGSALTIKTNSGADVQGGYLVAGSIVAGYVSGSTYRLISDVSTAADKTAAEAAAGRAEAAAVAADATLASAVKKTDTATTGFAFVVDEDDMASDSETLVPTQQSVKAYVDTLVSFSVADRTALKALDTTKHNSVLLRESGREGLFTWRTGNFAAQISLDTLEGIFVKANAIASTAGAWVRSYEGEILAEWFGPSSNPADLAYLDPNFDITSIPTVELWNFNDGTVQGWTGNVSTVSNVANHLRAAATGALPGVVSPVFSRRGCAGDKVIIRTIKRAGTFTTTSNLRLFWAANYPSHSTTAAHGFNASYLSFPVAASTYVINDNEYNVFVFDMPNATGGWDWVANLLTQIRIDLTGAADAVVDIDYIAIAAVQDYAAANNLAIKMADALSVPNVIMPRKPSYAMSASIKPLNGMNIKSARSTRIVMNANVAIEISEAVGNVPLRSCNMEGFHFVNGLGKDYTLAFGLFADAHRDCEFKDFFFSSYDSGAIVTLNPKTDMALNPKAKPEGQNVLFNKYSHWHIERCRTAMDIAGGATPGPVTNLITHNLWEDIVFRWVSDFGIVSKRWHDNDQFNNIFIGLSKDGAKAIVMSEDPTVHVGVSAHHFDGLTLVRDGAVAWTNCIGISLNNAPRMVFDNVRSDNTWPIPSQFINNPLGMQMKFNSSFAHANWGALNAGANMVDVINIDASRKSGTVVANSGTTSVVIPFELWDDPDEWGFTPMSNPAVHCWVSAATRTGMTISFASALGANTTFRWWVQSRKLQ